MKKTDLKIEKLRNKKSLMIIKDNIFYKIIRKIKKSLSLDNNKTTI